MQDHNITLGQEIRGAFALASNRADLNDLQLEVMSDKFAKILENLLDDLNNEIEKIDLGGDLHDRQKELVRAMMDGELPVQLSYNLGMVQNPEDILYRIPHLESYINLHRECKNNDIDILLGYTQTSDGGVMFKLGIDGGTEYGGHYSPETKFTYPDLTESSLGFKSKFKI